ncbi:MAG: hypothetical protein HY662_03265 [Chloroflexi bacterium]|nr:hypothetical protein [Chloroflexota bacterium]
MTNVMFYVSLGCFGFLVVHLFDVISLKRLPAIKPITWICGSILLVYALARLSLNVEKLAMPGWTGWLGWWVFSFSFLLLIFALFVNLPFRKTYVDKGVGDQLITTGLYALVRHPGVHWFSLALGSLLLISRSSELLFAVPLFILLDILLVVLQDRFFFARMFPDYDSYRKTTPMLIPNWQSIRAFMDSLLAYRAKKQIRRKQWKLLSS